jgi:dUTP pyrophosphatase
VKIQIRSADLSGQDVLEVGDPFQFGTQSMWVESRAPQGYGPADGWVYTISDERPKVDHGRGVMAVVKYPEDVESDGANILLPAKGYEDDAGFDLYTSFPRTIEPGQVVDLPTSIAVELPEGFWGMIVGRSSALRKRGLLVNTGIIDAGYRGELFVNVRNMTEEPVLVARGERLGQLIPFATVQLMPKWVDRLNDSERGMGAFGSTGA